MKQTFGTPSPEAGLGQILDVERIIEETETTRISPEDFRGNKFFPDDEIDADLAHCHRIDQIIDGQKKDYTPEKRVQYERGLAAEHTLRHAITEFGWLAENVKGIIPSRYDDYVRGIDFISQIVLGDSRFEHLGFAMDFAAAAADAGEKIRRTFDALDQGFTPSVKYFQSEKTGQLRNFKLPRIVVGASPESLERLATYSAEIMSGSGIAASVAEEIRNDPFRAVLFGEIEAQLDIFIHRLEKVVEKAKKEGRADIEKRAEGSLDIHRKALAVIQELAEEAGIDISVIKKHARGDVFAGKMAQALSLLSQTPIVFEEPRKAAKEPAK